MKNNIELLAPVGNFDCLISAVQNGADAVYFGADKFNARANGENFAGENLKKAIEYAKLRNVKTHLTLNILIKNDEFEDAINLVKYAYECGIDAVIVQDLGLARYIIQNFKGLEVHASTQMTTYDLAGVKELEQLGFNRAVLARELTIPEIKEICKGSKIDIEVFIHGALCISYSGQCLASSIIGGRSGNRGKCAGTCRLPYTLINKETNTSCGNGYLLSSKDVCTLDILKDLVSSGIKSFKIEGRMKSPEYVGVTTSIYRKYINLALSDKPYIVEEDDRKALMQVFNRGGFSTGYLNGKLGKSMIYTIKPNHMGVCIGKVLSYAKWKGYVKLKLTENLLLGDSVQVNNDSCKISELMKDGKNIKQGIENDIVVIGRLKGDIHDGDKVYRTVSQSLTSKFREVISKENIKRKIILHISGKTNAKMNVHAIDMLTGCDANYELPTPIAIAENLGTTIERIKDQFSKTGGTVFEVNDIVCDLPTGIYMPINEINEGRRFVLIALEQQILQLIPRSLETQNSYSLNSPSVSPSKKNISLLLNYINTNFEYLHLSSDISRVYIPITEFLNNSKANVIETICKHFETYLYLPAIIKGKFKELLEANLDKIVSSKIKGFVVSNMSQLELIGKYNLNTIANYTFNIFNDLSINELEKLGISDITISPEASRSDILSINTNLNKELIVYGKCLLMTSEYCVVGKYINCDHACQKGKYILKDRLGFDFPVYTNPINCNNMIYNSKITSINWADLNITSIRLDILDETIEEINSIVQIHKANKRLEGNNYTNGNLNKEI